MTKHRFLAVLLSIFCTFPIVENVQADIVNGFSLLDGPTNLSIDLTVNGNSDNVDLIITSQEVGWFAIGFGSQFADGSYAIVHESGSGVQERVLGNFNPGIQLADSLTVVSDTVSSGVRTLHLQRDRVGLDANYYTFQDIPGVVDINYSLGSGSFLNEFPQQSPTGAFLQLSPVPEPNSVAFLAMTFLAISTRTRRR